MRTFKEKVITDVDGSIISAEILKDGCCRLTIAIDDGNSDDVLIKASELSLNDRFMLYGPTINVGKKGLLKRYLKDVIEKGIKDFYRPRIDPSFTTDGNGLCYIPGNQPAFGKPYAWWVEKAKELNPERRSRLGTQSEYVAFLGVLIKTLVDCKGWKIDDAWNAVCNDSVRLGHYWDSKNAKCDDEPTGSRCICGFCDLANREKILAPSDGKEGFYTASGFWKWMGDGKTLSTHFYHGSDIDTYCLYCTGWIVYER